MHNLSVNPAESYRKVDLDARIEASSGEDLTLICLEEVIAALGQAMHALDRQPDRAPSDTLSRAHGIAIFLNRSVSPENPLYSAMKQFYGGLASGIAQNMARPSRGAIEQIRGDFADVLEAAKAVRK